MAYVKFTSSAQDCTTALKFWSGFVVPFINIGDVNSIQTDSAHESGGEVLNTMPHKCAQEYLCFDTKNAVCASAVCSYIVCMPNYISRISHVFVSRNAFITRN